MEVIGIFYLTVGFQQNIIFQCFLPSLLVDWLTVVWIHISFKWFCWKWQEIICLYQEFDFFLSFPLIICLSMQKYRFPTLLLDSNSHQFSRLQSPPDSLPPLLDHFHILGYITYNPCISTYQNPHQIGMHFPKSNRKMWLNTQKFTYLM